MVWAASHSRWVLVGQSAGVIRHSMWRSRHIRWMSGLSVATHTSCIFSDFFTCWYTHQSMGLPQISIKGLPCSRLEPYRAGMIATARILYSSLPFP